MTTATRRPRPRKPAADRSKVSDANRHADATKAQIAYAHTLAQSRGYRNFQDARHDMRGKSPVGQIKREEMSLLIDWLKQDD